MSSMMKFLRTNSSFSPGSGPSSPSAEASGNGAEEQERTFGQQRPSRRLPPALHLNDQTAEESPNTSNNNSPNSRENAVATTSETSSRRGSSRKIFGWASKFPFYHAYLTEEQEEDAFKNHLFKTGSYLMRDSKSNSHAVTLSVVIDPYHLYHFQVVKAVDHFSVVGTGQEFATLEEVIRYYETHTIPGKTDDPVFLEHPVNICPGPNKASPKSPLASATSTHGRTGLANTGERSQRRPRKSSSQKSADDGAEHDKQQQSTFIPVPRPNPDISLRPPMPIPRPSMSVSGHDYSEVDHPDLDRLKMVLELCRQSDVMHASRKKCTCGLYLEESILTQDWMMHVDNEPGKTQGRIFFLDTKTSRTTWTLPDEIGVELQEKFPVKWDFVMKQMAACKRKSPSP